MSTMMDFNILIPTLLLIVACGFDLKTGKFPNWLFLASSGLCLILFASQGPTLSALGARFLSAFLILFALSPLVLLRALGGGDLKLLGVLAFTTNLPTTFSILLASLFWGLLLGTFRMALAGELITFTQSLILRNPQVKSQKIPYTFALLLGWLTFLSQRGLL